MSFIFALRQRPARAFNHSIHSTRAHLKACGIALPCFPDLDTFLRVFRSSHRICARLRAISGDCRPTFHYHRPYLLDRDKNERRGPVAKSARTEQKKSLSIFKKRQTEPGPLRTLQRVDYGAPGGGLEGVFLSLAPSNQSASRWREFLQSAHLPLNQGHFLI